MQNEYMMRRPGYISYVEDIEMIPAWRPVEKR